MATYTTGKDLASSTRARAAKLKKIMGEVVIAQAKAGAATSRGITHGPQRPVSFRGKVSPVRPIGRRTGKLFSGWRVRRVSSGQANARKAALYNVAAHHQYVLRPGGTRRMTDRGYWRAQREASAPSRLSIARKGQLRALKG